MKIDKAIEILDYHVKEHDFDPDGETNDAIKLSIEALKREQKFRLPAFKGHVKLLPGETVD